MESASGHVECLGRIQCRVSLTLTELLTRSSPAALFPFPLQLDLESLSTASQCKCINEYKWSDAESHAREHLDLSELGSIAHCRRCWKSWSTFPDTFCDYAYQPSWDSKSRPSAQKDEERHLAPSSMSILYALVEIAMVWLGS